MEIFNAIGLEIPKGKTIKRFSRRCRTARRSLAFDALGRHDSRVLLAHRFWTRSLDDALRIGDGRSFSRRLPTGFSRSLHAESKPLVFIRRRSRWRSRHRRLCRKSPGRNFLSTAKLNGTATKIFERKFLTVGLCGLAYRARVAAADDEALEWRRLSETAGNSDADQADWRLSGHVINYNALRNPFSGSDLYWIHLDLGNFELEILVNRRRLIGDKLLRVGANVKADVWLQGHIVAESTFLSSYEGVDWSGNAADFWKNYKKLN
jgi:hypothetical protein